MMFTYPAFLWGLLAVLIPVAVHLFNLRRYRKVYFSNVERLSELQSESRRQNSLRQWLVLAARVVAVAALVVAFARPVAGRPTAGTEMEGNVAVSIYIDNSFSMESASGDGSLLDLARQKALEVASAYGRGVQYQLLTSEMDGSEMRWLNRDELAEAVESIEPSAAAPLMSTVATRQSDFLRQSRASARHAYLISDFQQSTADLAALPDDSTVRYTLVPLTGIEADNIYIDTLTLDAPAYFAGGAVAVAVTVRNSGNRDAEKVPLKLYLDGRERAMTTVDLAAHAEATATLRFSIDHAGWTDGMVTVEDYPVTFDDSYHFSLTAGERIKMLEIDGRTPNSALQKLFGHDTTVVYRCERHLPPTLAEYSFAVLNEVASLTSGEEQQLAAWVREGGSLMVVPPATGGEGLNTLLGSLQAPQLGQWNRQTLRATSIDDGSSLYRSVFAGKNDDVEMPTVQGHYTLMAQTAIKQSIIALADGSDMLTMSPSGEGKVYLFALPLSDEWSDFASQALFVPTVYNMALYSRPQAPASYTLGGSEPIVLQGRYDTEQQPPQLSDGAETSITPDLRRMGNRQVMVPHGELSKAGIYRLGDEHLAFNYPRRESELRYYSREEVAAAVAGRENYNVVHNSRKPIADELRARDKGHSLWRLFVLLALAALAVETILLKMRSISAVGPGMVRGWSEDGPGMVREKTDERRRGDGAASEYPEWKK